MILREDLEPKPGYCSLRPPGRAGFLHTPPVISLLSLEFTMPFLVLMHKTPESNLLRDHGDKENFGKIKQKRLNATRGRNPGAIFRVFFPLSLEQQVKYFHSSLHKFVCNSVRKLHLKVRA